MQRLDWFLKIAYTTKKKSIFFPLSKSKVIVMNVKTLVSKNALDLHIYDQLILDRHTTAIQWEENSLFN